jgi:sn-glycerol 3-phosphate transport system permease protein
MNSIISQITTHGVLAFGVLLMIVPVWVIFASSTHDNYILTTEGLQFIIGDNFVNNYLNIFFETGGFSDRVTLSTLFLNSFIMAFGIAFLSVITSLMSAYTIVYFRIKFATLFFWIIFITLLIPLEVRILPSYQVVSNLNLVNTYAGLILPLTSSAIATLFFRQFLKTIPEELLESAKLDGVSSWQFFKDFLIPLAKPMLIAIFVFMFVYGYNQYLWPIISTSKEKYWTVVMGMKIMFWGNPVSRLSYIILSIIPPLFIVMFLQKWFIKGLIQTEK